MDAKETLTRLPLSGSLFIGLLVITFFLCRMEDHPIQTDVFTYHAQHLLKIEAPIYEDFYSKRLAIEQKGSADRLELFRAAQKDNLEPLISQLILSDRSFRPYLNEKSHLFFSAREVENWRKHSQHLEQSLQGLSSYQFALIPEQFIATPEISRLFSYLFIETDLLNLLSNVFCLLFMFILLEAYVIRRLFWAILFCLSLAHGCLYLSFASPLTAPLSGVNVLVYFMFSLGLCRYLNGYFHSRSSLQLNLAILIGIVCIVKTGLDIYYQSIFPTQSAGILLAVASGFTLAYQGMIWRPKPSESTNTTNAVLTESDLPAEYRKAYQEALTALTRFNFAYARSTLAQLHAQLPTSTQLLESRYHLEKLHPDEEHFWSLLKSRLERAIKLQDYNLLLKLFNDMQKYADTGQDELALLPPSMSLQILQIFLTHHNLEQAEYTFRLLEISAERATLKQACQLLIEYFSIKKLLEKRAYYQSMHDEL